MVSLGFPGTSPATAGEEIALDTLDRIAVDEETVKVYADAFGMDAEQAELQLKQQELAAEFHDRLREETGAWYAGVEFRHLPSFSVRVFTPTRAPKDLFERVVDDYQKDLEIVFEDVEYTKKELRERLVDATDAVRVAVDASNRDDYRGAAFVDEVRQLVVVHAMSQDLDDTVVAVTELKQRSPGPEIVVEARSVWDTEETTGGQDAGCMVAFTVRSINQNSYGRLGVATAGHCQNNNVSLNHPELGSLAYVGSAYYNTTYDLAWAVASTNNADYDDDIRLYETMTRDVAGVGGNAGIDQLLCHTVTRNGVTTSKCGWAYSNDYCPTDTATGCDSSNYTFDGNYVLMLHPSSPLGDTGDSGGPWRNTTSSSIVYGVHAGSSGDDRVWAFRNLTFGSHQCPSNGCYMASFTAAQWLDNSPVQLSVMTSHPTTCGGKEVTHWGNSNSETIKGTSGADVIYGGGGNDTIYGYGGNDTICGGSGNDKIYGGSGNDVIYGQSGADTIYAWTGTDTCDGGSSSDYGKRCETLSSIESGWGTFFDDDESVHVGDIEWIASYGVTDGCNPSYHWYCPKDNMTRLEMAEFLYSAYHNTSGFSNPPSNYDPFTDDGNNAAIEWMKYNGITSGCNPPSNNQYCPNNPVPRKHMAVFLARVHRISEGLPPNSGLPTAPWSFTDINGLSQAPYIEYIKDIGVTYGCNPPSNTLFCPNTNTTREQMASFVKRILD